MRHLLAICFASAPLLTAPLRAQTDAVPRELAMAAIRAASPTTAMNDPQITVGDVAPELKGRIVAPEQGRILGSVAYAGNIEVLGTSRLIPEDVARWYAEDLVKRGFRPIDPASVGSMDRGGFRHPVSGTPTVFCNDGDRFTVVTRRSPDGLTHFRIRATLTGSSDGSCGRPEFYGSTGSTSTSWGGTRPFSLPLLVNPGLAMGFCDSSPGPHGNTDTRLGTSLSSSELFDHYAKQLRDQGWSHKETLPAVIGVWTRADSTGRSSRAVLSVVPIPGMSNCKRASLQINQDR